MNQHQVNPLEPDNQPRCVEIAREEAFRDLPQAQIRAINCLIDIIDEPYTGDDDADSTSAGTKSPPQMSYCP
jgi:hypothetical protein